jgi:uncharacterized protein YjbI with pentapeptide repeats
LIATLPTGTIGDLKGSVGAVADQEHVELLNKGVAEWNAWRLKEAVQPDLSEADLITADLDGADLTSADLDETDLTSADLTGALLGDANLRDGILRSADMTGADLARADLRGADMTGANLTSVHLRMANLSGAKLSGANLHEAELSETVFADVDLTSAVGLETCHHYGPSIVDHRTLQKSGPLPRAFLRGVGLPELLIGYLPSLHRAIQHYSCFIS